MLWSGNTEGPILTTAQRAWGR